MVGLGRNVKEERWMIVLVLLMMKGSDMSVRFVEFFVCAGMAGCI